MSTIPGNVPADNVAAVMAKGFHAAAHHLDSLLAIPGIENDMLGVIGYSVSSVVLRAFATELALKALYMQETGKEQKHEHDLLFLFRRLEQTTQDSVEQRFEGIRGGKIAKGIYYGETDPLLQVLTNHRYDFEKWRYLQDQLRTSLNTQPLVLNSVIEAAMEEYTSRLPSSPSI